jgi:hypothetical protein
MLSYRRSLFEMVPVLRVVIPTANLTETRKEDGGQAHNIIVRGLNSDYITDDPNGNKSVPVQAVYAARMNDRGQITVVRARQAGFTPTHTYAGWPIPA